MPPDSYYAATAVKMTIPANGLVVPAKVTSPGVQVMPEVSVAVAVTGSGAFDGASTVKLGKFPEASEVWVAVPVLSVSTAVTAFTTSLAAAASAEANLTVRVIVAPGA